MADLTEYGELAVQGLTLEKLARYVADITVGHDHDGSNSKLVSSPAAHDLGEHDNVSGTVDSPADEEFLVYDTGAGEWRERYILAGDLPGHTHGESDIVDLDHYDSADFDTDFAAKDTDDLAEGSSNLYYTDGRADTWLTGKDTGDLSEGSNLYWTTGRGDARIAAADLEDLNDVVAYASLADDEILQWNTAAGGWRHRTLAEAGIAGGAHTHDADDWDAATWTQYGIVYALTATSLTTTAIASTGAIVYSIDGTSWSILAAGTQDYVLTMGASAPAWAALPATSAHVLDPDSGPHTGDLLVTNIELLADTTVIIGGVSANEKRALTAADITAGTFPSGTFQFTGTAQFNGMAHMNNDGGVLQRVDGASSSRWQIDYNTTPNQWEWEIWNEAGASQGVTLTLDSDTGIWDFATGKLTLNGSDVLAAAHTHDADDWDAATWTQYGIVYALTATSLTSTTGTAAGCMLYSTDGTSWAPLTKPGSTKFLKHNATTPLWADVTWSDVTSKPTEFTPSAHDIEGSKHTASGLTAGWVLRASGATTFAFAALLAADIPDLGAAKITSGKLAIGVGGTNSDATDLGTQNKFLIYNGTRITASSYDQASFAQLGSANTFTAQQTIQVSGVQLELREAASGVTYVEIYWDDASDRLTFQGRDSGDNPLASLYFDLTGTNAVLPTFECSGTIQVDTLIEYTGAAGVTVDDVQMHDGDVNLTAARGIEMKTAQDSYLYITGDTGSSAGGNIVLFGSTHSGNANDIQLRSGATTKLLWDDSVGWWSVPSGVELVLGTDPGGSEALRVGGNVRIEDELVLEDTIQFPGVAGGTSLDGRGLVQRAILTSHVHGSGDGITGYNSVDISYDRFLGCDRGPATLTYSNVTGGANIWAGDWSNLATITGGAIGTITVDFDNFPGYGTDDATGFIYTNGVIAIYFYSVEGGYHRSPDNVKVEYYRYDQLVHMVDEWVTVYDSAVDVGDNPLLINSQIGNYVKRVKFTIDNTGSSDPCRIVAIKWFAHRAASNTDRKPYFQPYSNTTQYFAVPTLSFRDTSWTEVLSIAGASGNLTTSGYIKTTGDWLICDRTGDAADAGVKIHGDAGQYRWLEIHTGASSARWRVGADTTAEGGSNAGSDLAIWSYDDAGSFIRQNLLITRSSGNWTATTGTVYFNMASGSAFTIDHGYLRIDRGGDTAAAQLLIDRDAAQYGTVYFRTGTSNRWAVRVDNAAEGEPASGSNFEIARYNNAAAQLNIPIEIERSSGDITLAATTGDVIIRSDPGGSEVFRVTGAGRFSSSLRWGGGAAITSSDDLLQNPYSSELELRGSENQVRLQLREDTSIGAAYPDGAWYDSPELQFTCSYDTVLSGENRGEVHANVYLEFTGSEASKDTRLVFVVDSTDIMYLHDDPMVELPSGVDLKIGGLAWTPKYDKGSSGNSTVTVNFWDGNEQYINLTNTSSIEITCSNEQAGAVVVLSIRRGSGSAAITWNSKIKWGDGSSPTNPTTAGDMIEVTLHGHTTSEVTASWNAITYSSISDI